MFGIIGHLNTIQYFPSRSGTLDPKAKTLSPWLLSDVTTPPRDHLLTGTTAQLVTRRAGRSPLAGQDSVGAASVFRPRDPG